MKILSAEVDNFASYKHLSFDFTNQGLTMISGPTGSGKSTLCDIIPWILFGVTAKNGSVDEIRSWNTDEATIGKLIFSYGSHTYYVRRIRGKSNDLFYGFHTDYMTEGKRGKDLNDTQKQINQIIGLTAETYLSGAYFHEFSQTAQFFTTTAKIRRSITEQLADLSLAKSLQENLTLYNKDLKKERDGLMQKVLLGKNTLEQLTKTHDSEVNRAIRWDELHKENIVEIANKAKDYMILKEKAVKALIKKFNEAEEDNQDKIASIMAEIKELQEQIKPEDHYPKIQKVISAAIKKQKELKCKECGAPKDIDEVLVLDRAFYAAAKDESRNVTMIKEVAKLNARLSVLSTYKNPYTELIQEEKVRKNTYLDELKVCKETYNPHINTYESTYEVIKSTRLEIKSTEVLIKDLSVEQADIELLLDVMNTFRSSIIEQTVSYIEKSTNSLLNDHFDAEIRVVFSAKDSDKLDIEITKDGNSCSYTQLSKGQRQLLKLCFGVSVMRAVSNHQGINFNCIFFDEALDGMDESIRAKSFNLLEKLSLEYESVFVVDHSEAFKSLFTNRINVELVDGGSEIEKTV